MLGNTGMDIATADFSLPSGPSVEFGMGAVRRIPERLADARRVFVVTDPGLRAAGVLDRVLEPLTEHGIAVRVFDEVPANPTTEIVETAATRAAEFAVGQPTAVLAVGGGSSVDAAKGIALLAANPGARADGSGVASAAPGLPLLAVPTTAGTGAETNGFGVLEDRSGRRKVYCGAESVLPRVAILDPELTVGLPAAATAATGVDALVHGVESLTSRGRNPVSELYATRAVELAAEWLPRAVADGSDRAARANMLLAAHLAGLALTRSGLGLVHGLAHAISLHCGAVHGLALSAVLAETVAFSLAADEPGYARVASAVGARDAYALPDVLDDLVDRVGVRRTVAELGCADAQRESLVATALADPVSANAPRSASAAELHGLLDRCW
ncbi:alcohol dehydrogenase/alcohol dehydrogenase [Tamaricihabitans halophyticus]|uniref:Alcohol dehydrogenase/alcohol dehydrogenase n=1 Tax=Tamaricihabitans halophyticus TaxID=1262583 RepID=A0A4R2QFN1_9PSEU|nr:iron-containing alcohol dehydrogenase [Tamaricihabitans halophyticus]TCP47950.1 alcohol dehydrogenase/alcohol dehydrogenase [Tamaricihabitans halophyticus]